MTAVILCQWNSAANKFLYCGNDLLVRGKLVSKIDPSRRRGDLRERHAVFSKTFDKEPMENLLARTNALRCEELRNSQRPFVTDEV